MGGEVSASLDYEIAPEELKAQQEAGADVVLLDVREPWEFEIAKIADSKPIPMGDIPARFNQELDPEDHIVVRLPSWRALDECNRMAAAARFRKGAIVAGRDRPLGAAD